MMALLVRRWPGPAYQAAIPARYSGPRSWQSKSWIVSPSSVASRIAAPRARPSISTPASIERRTPRPRTVTCGASIRRP